jgi:starch synthase
MTKTIKVLFLSSEAEPFIKIGGLADVAGSLPLAMRALNPQEVEDVIFDLRMVLPLHRNLHIESNELQLAVESTLNRRNKEIPYQAFITTLEGMPVYLINGDPIADADSVYSIDLEQDREKYTFFSLASLELLQHINWQPEIIHANDWHTALSLYNIRKPAYLHQVSPRTLLTVHNLPYMGGDSTNVLNAYGLSPLNDPLMPKWARTQPLPLGLWSADAIIPVSPTYAKEILTPEFGCGLEPCLIMCKERITGILNGLDVLRWDPMTDPNLAERFNVNKLDGREANKTALQTSLGLKVDAHVPLLSMVGRIDWQKGLDIAFEVLQELKDQSWQFILLGSGDAVLEGMAREMQSSFPERVRAVIRYDTVLSHLIYGSADIFLMPSRYEPCGLAQMISMRYGCVPVVSATGGLLDTVKDETTGFLFERDNSASMLTALEKALDTFLLPEKWKRMQQNGMKEDFSWHSSALQYATIYRSLISGRIQDEIRR